MEITGTEAFELFNAVSNKLGNLFEMIRAEVKESVGRYKSELMDNQLTDFLGRRRYEESFEKLFKTTYAALVTC